MKFKTKWIDLPAREKVAHAIALLHDHSTPEWYRMAKRQNRMIAIR